MSAQQSNSYGIGFPGILTVLFVGLKLTNHIDWTWLWVLSPLWITFVVVFTLVLIYAALK